MVVVMMPPLLVRVAAPTAAELESSMLVLVT
jgi:hypothetical protein